ncbi:MAG: tRNA 2-thiouridine(34) synthase MnmA [Gammaproteobacteria bacterium]|jgi:tRNA-specific 2-thiouridylase
MSKKSKVIVGMSGGVDSSVAALLLQKQGFLVEGLFMNNWEEPDVEATKGCQAGRDLTDAAGVCGLLGIKLHTMNFADEYWDRVFTYFLEEYKAGRTPNPDILCNKEIKFKAFLEYALELGADYIATGHFVRKRKIDGKFQLLKGMDSNKDQSYFLYTLQQHQLAKSLFPIGDLTKDEVRKIAQENNFRNHAKKDSVGICFIGERKFKDFLNKFLPSKPGEIKTADGEVIGKHDGLMYYTLGQRQGIGIGGRKDTNEAPWYVLKKDLKNNVLIVGQGHDHPLLFSNSLQANNLDWVSGSVPRVPLKCKAKTRYRQKDQACVIDSINDEARVIFDESQWAVTPGQSVVFYQDEICLGGGVII